MLTQHFFVNFFEKNKKCHPSPRHSEHGEGALFLLLVITGPDPVIQYSWNQIPLDRKLFSIIKSKKNLQVK